MMGLSARHIGELVSELEPLLRGTRVQAVAAHPPRDLFFVLLPSGSDERILRLRLSAEAGLARLHLQIERIHRHAGASSPFFAAVEEAFTGASDFHLEQLAGDRIVAVRARRPPPRDGARASLILELTGRHPNFLLLDAGGRIAARLIEPGAKSRSFERLAVGATYAPPGGRTPPPGEDLLSCFPRPPDGPSDLAGRAPLSWTVESSLGREAFERHAEAESAELRRRLERRRRGAADLVRGLKERARQADRAERVRQDGELLNAHITEVRRGMAEITLPDSFLAEAPPRTIQLDEGLNPRRNVEKLFARYRKLKRSAERLPEELALAEATLDRIEDFFQRMQEGSRGCAELEEEALGCGVLLPKQETHKKTRREPRRPYLIFRSARGAEIRVGRSAADNDALTFHQSRGNDLWLHTSDAPGSHVILRLEKGQEPDPQDTLDAAHLAAHFSPLRGAGKIDVHVARRKDVRKPRGAKPGLVVLSAGKTLRVRVDAERLRRLLETRRGPDRPPGNRTPRP